MLFRSRYVRDWNANAKTSTVAQRVLHAVVKLRRADEIVRAFDQTAAINALGDLTSTDGAAAPVSKGSKGASALRELVEALIPYTERHLARMEKLIQESYVVDYLLSEMDDGLFDGAGDEAMEDDLASAPDGHGEEDWGVMEVDVGAGVTVVATA